MRLPPARPELAAGTVGGVVITARQSVYTSGTVVAPVATGDETSLTVEELTGAKPQISASSGDGFTTPCRISTSS